MPSENKTQNYELNQWQGNEYVKRQDFVDDNIKIDTALTPTADPALTPSSNGPFKLVSWVSYFANRIKSITGKANWWESPSKNLEDFNTHLAEKANDNVHGLAFKGCLLRLSANVSVPSGNTSYKLPFNNALYDTNAFFNAAQSTRITIPSGVNKVKLMANIAWGVGSVGNRACVLFKNNSSYTAGAFSVIDQTNTIADPPNTRLIMQNGSSAVIDVVAGDYFELSTWHYQGTALDVAQTATWFCLEVVE